MGFLSNLFGTGNKGQRFTPPPPPSADEVALAESSLKIKFPASFLSFMTQARPMQLNHCAIFYWVGGEGLKEGNIVVFNRREREEASSPLPSFLISFYNDGMGNQVCFDTRYPAADGEYPIVFWDHELSAEENLDASTKASESNESTGIVARSFPDWLKTQNIKPV